MKWKINDSVGKYLVIAAIVFIFLVLYNNKANNVNAQDVYETFKESITRYAAAFGVPASIILGVIMAESSGNPNVPDGASRDRGLMQITPVALQDVNSVYGYNFDYNSLIDSDINIQVGTAFLALQIKRLGGNLKEGIQAYNSGAGAIEKNPDSDLSYFDKVNAFSNSINIS